MDLNLICCVSGFCWPISLARKLKENFSALTFFPLEPQEQCFHWFFFFFLGCNYHILVGIFSHFASAGFASSCCLFFSTRRACTLKQSNSVLNDEKSVWFSATASPFMTTEEKTTVKNDSLGYHNTCLSAYPCLAQSFIFQRLLKQRLFLFFFFFPNAKRVLFLKTNAVFLRLNPVF